MAIGNPVTLTSNVASKTISVIATAGQTLFTVTGGYRINQLAVFRNGVRLLDSRDYEARNGATVTLLSAATVGDALEFQVFDDFRVADAIVSAESEQTISGNLTVSGILTATDLRGSDVTFRHVKATGISTVSDTTQATSTTTGAFIVSGGVGIAKSLFVGGDMSVAGTLTYEDVTNTETAGITTTGGLVVTGLGATFGSGVGIADSIYHIGDDNTAIRFPATDTFTVETAGSERLRINSSGNVSIGGTEGITYSLLKGLAINVDNGDAGIIVNSSSSAHNAYISFGYGDSGAVSHADQFSAYIGRVGDDTLILGTNNNIRLRVDSNGHVGINTVPSSWESGADTSVLQIDGASVACINDTDFFATSNAYWDGSNWEYIQTGEAVSYYQYNDERKHVFRSAASGSPGGTVSWTNQLVIDTTGAILTGIATVTEGLVLDGQNGSGKGLRLDLAGSGDYIIQETTTDDVVQFGGTGSANFFTHNISSGNIGVGTNNPSGTLTVYGDSSSSFRISKSGVLAYDHTFNGSTYTIANNNGSAGIPIIIGTKTSGGESLRIDSNGRVLQGKTATKGSTGENIPTYCTEITSNNPNVLEIANNGTGANAFSALVLSRSDGTSVNSHTAVDNGDKIGEVCFIGADGADRFNTAASIHVEAGADFTANDCPANLIFSTNAGAASASERLRITSRGDFIFNNGMMIENVNINTTARNGTQNVDLADGMVHYFTSSSTGSWKPNFRVSSSVNLNGLMSTGDTASVTMIVNKSNTSHIATTIQIDGSDVTPEFLGGVHSDGGGNNTFDVYHYTIIKTGDGAFTVFASVNNYT